MKCNTEEKRAGSQPWIQELSCKYGFTQSYTIFITEIKHAKNLHIFNVFSFFFLTLTLQRSPSLLPIYIYLTFFCITLLKDSKWLTMMLHQDPEDSTTILLYTGKSVNESWQRSNLESFCAPGGLSKVSNWHVYAHQTSCLCFWGRRSGAA